MGGHGPLQPVDEQQAVRQAGQRIVRRVVHQLVLGAPPFDHAAELGADLPDHAQQLLVRTDRFAMEELQHAQHVVADQDGEGEGGVQPARPRGVGAGEVVVLGDIGDPGRAARAQHPARQSLAGDELGLLVQRYERREPVGVGGVPDVGRRQARRPGRRQPIGVAVAPAGVVAHRPHGDAQGLLDRAALVGDGGDGLQQHQLLLALIEVAQALLGDGLGVQPRGALALEPVFQLEQAQVEFGDGVFRWGGGLALVQRAHRISMTHLASPWFMQAA